MPLSPRSISIPTQAPRKTVTYIDLFTTWIWRLYGLPVGCYPGVQYIFNIFCIIREINDYEYCRFDWELHEYHQSNQSLQAQISVIVQNLNKIPCKYIKPYFLYSSGSIHCVCFYDTHAVDAFEHASMRAWSFSSL